MTGTGVVEMSLRELVKPVGRLLDTATGLEISAGQLLARSRSVAAGLRRIGLRAGDRIGLLLPNGVDWFVLHLAAAELGLLTVPVNTRYRRTEIAELLRRSGCRALAVDTAFRGLGFAETVRALVEQDGLEFDVLITTGDDDLPGGVSLATLATTVADGPDAGPDLQAPLIVFGTSGTTSAPKLAMHVVTGVTEHARHVAAALGLGPDDVVLGLLPPCGAYGYTVAMAALAAGARLVLLPTFSPSGLADLVAEHGVTFLAATEAILRPALAATGAMGKLGTWRVGVTAGGSVTDLVTTLDAAGTRLVNVYGSSELLALTALRDPAADGAARAVPGGTPVGRGLEVRVADAASGEILPHGRDGELQFRGYCAFTGYLGQPVASAAARTADGWYRSGDHGRTASDGRSFDYLSRLADTMRLRGFLVDPAQVEEVLIAHPSVTVAQVVGVPVAATGEDVAIAFVVGGLPGHRPIEEADLAGWCRERLAGFKVPARFVVIDAIPTTPSANGDKALKRALRERAARILDESP